MKLRGINKFIIIVFIALIGQCKAAHAIGFNPVLNKIDVSSPITGMADAVEISKNLLKVEWVVSKSNPNFGFREVEGEDLRSLELKSFKSNKVYVLFKSSVVESFSQIKDVSPDGRVIIFEVASRVAGGIVRETHVLAFNGRKSLMLSDGIVRKEDTASKLESISFADTGKEVDLVFSDIKGKLRRKSIDLQGHYSLNLQSKADLDAAINAFYNGALPHGLKVSTKDKQKDTTIVDIKLDSKIAASPVVKHRLYYDHNSRSINKLEELATDAQIVRSTHYDSKGLATVTDAQGEVIYAKRLAGRPSVAVISSCLYLYEEVKVFYNRKLPSNAKVMIKDNQVELSMPGAKVHRLWFANSFNRYSDYGFYMLEETTDNELDNLFVFSSKRDRMKWHGTIGGEKVAVYFRGLNKVTKGVLSFVPMLLRSHLVSIDQNMLNLDVDLANKLVELNINDDSPIIGLI